MLGIDIIALTAIAMPVLIIAIVMWYVYQNRRLLHQERMAMIEKGLSPQDMPEDKPQISRHKQLTDGIITSAVGLALLLGLGTIGFGPWLLGGLIPLAIGLGQIIGYLTTMPPKKPDDAA
jgi:hypothetical protein